jgi:hypothetical protein
MTGYISDELELTLQRVKAYGGMEIKVHALDVGELPPSGRGGEEEDPTPNRAVSWKTFCLLNGPSLYVLAVCLCNPRVMKPKSERRSWIRS